MGAGAAASKKYGAADPGPEATDAAPKKQAAPKIIQAKTQNDGDKVHDQDDWRVPGKKGSSSNTSRGTFRGAKPAPPPKTPKTRRLDGLPFREDGAAAAEEAEVSKWSPRQGGLSKTEREALEAKKKEQKVTVKLPPLPVMSLLDGALRDNDAPSPQSKPIPGEPRGHLSLQDAAMRTTATSSMPTSLNPNLLALPNMVPEDTLAIENLIDEVTEAADFEPANYDSLADVADMAWKELLRKVSSAKNEDIGSLFVYQDLLDAVETATKKISNAQRHAAGAAGLTQKHELEIDMLCEEVLRKARHPKIGAAHPWKRGDLAVRGRKGLCELMNIQKSGSGRIKIRVITTGETAGAEPSHLLPLDREAETSMRKKLDEYDKALKAQAKMEKELAKVHRDMKVEHGELCGRLDKELVKHDIAEVIRPPAQTGMPSTDLVGQIAGKSNGPSMPSYPGMEGLLKAAEAMLQQAALGQALPATTSPIKAPPAMNALTNSIATNGADPSVPPGITRAMLPTPLRYQVEDDAEGEPLVRVTPKAAAMNPLPAPPAEEEVDGGEWVQYEDEEGDAYYYNEETNETVWELPIGARIRSAETTEMHSTPVDALDVSLESGSPSARPGIWQNIPPTEFDSHFQLPGSMASPTADAASEAPKVVAAQKVEVIDMEKLAASMAAKSEASMTKTPTKPKAPGPSLPEPSSAPQQYIPPSPQSLSWSPPQPSCRPQPDSQPQPSPVSQPHSAEPFNASQSLKMPQQQQPSAAQETLLTSVAPDPPMDVEPPSEPQLQSPPEAAEDWIEYHTAEGAPYYHNEATGETRWERPASYQASVDVSQAAATAAAAATAEAEAAAAAAAAATAAAAAAASQQAQYAQQAQYTQQPWPQQHAATQQQWSQQAAAAQQQQQWAQQQQAASQQQWFQQAAAQPDAAQYYAQYTAQQQNTAQYYAQYAQQNAASQAQAAQVQQDQWNQYYAEYWAWYQKEQDSMQKQGVEVDSGGLSPPPPGASVAEQLAFAMKQSVLKGMEAMMAEGASAEERRKELKSLQVKWHPDKNAEQREVAKLVFQMLGEKKEWFLADANSGPQLDIQVDAVD